MGHDKGFVIDFFFGLGRLTRVIRTKEPVEEEEESDQNEVAKSRETEDAATDESETPIYDRFNRVIAKSK